METMDLTMIENIEFEEKVDIEDPILPSKPMRMAIIEIKDILSKNQLKSKRSNKP